MGFFSAEYDVFVDTTVVRVVEDDQIPDVSRNSVVESVITGKDYTTTLFENLLNNSTANYQKAYNYAKNGHYVYGLPDTHIITSGRGAGEVKAAIEAEIGQTISIEYLEFAPLNHTHMAWQELYNGLGYNRETNEIESLSVAEGFAVYLDKIEPVYQTTDAGEPEPGHWSQWGESSLSGWTPERQITLSGNYLNVNPIIGPTETDGYNIHYVWQDDDGVIHRGSSFTSLTAYVQQEYFQVRYNYVDTDSVTYARHWTYQYNEGTYPEVDAVYDLVYQTNGTYFPFAVFKRNYINLADDSLSETSAYQSTSKLLEHLGIDFKSMGASIEENPDSVDIEQAVMMMAVPANSTNTVDIEYLFEFFNKLNDETPYEEVMDNPYAVVINNPYYRDNARSSSERTLTVPRASYAVVFQDADFRMTLSYGGITKKLKSGVLGKIGTVESDTSTHTYSTSVYNTSENPSHLNERSSGINRIYKKQVSANTYIEIVVIDPTMRYSIEGRYGTVAKAKDDNLLIPLDKLVCDKLGHLTRSKLYPRSLHFVFNSRLVQRLQWFQTHTFRVVLIVVTIAVTLLSGGFTSFLAEFAAAYAAGFTALALFLAKVVLFQLILNYAFRLIVREIGVEFAFYLAIVAAATGIAAHLDMVPGIGENMATTLLVASNGLIYGGNRVQTEDFNALLAEAEDYEDLVEDQLAELERANNLLNSDVHLHPFIIFGEKPGEYYNRTIHTGNPGIAGVEFVESFVDASLTLPDITDTLGGFHV